MPLSDHARTERRSEQRRRLRRRRAAVLAAVALVGAIAAVVLASAPHSDPTTAARQAARRPGAPAAAGASRHSLAVGKLEPGSTRVVSHGPARPEIALTFDDGFCAPCVAELVAALRHTGTHATFFPNGTYAQSWDPQAPAIRDLVASGQLVVGNHTFTHHDPRTETSDAFAQDLARNESWIEQTFGISGRPWFRPPYGSYDQSTVRAAGQLGYTRVVMWSGTLADSSPRSIPYLLNAIRYWARPGAIMLMHGNYPNTARALPQMLAILRQRGLRPVTIAEFLRP